MGQFSWIYSDTNKQMVDNRVADSYLLVPGPFQQKYGMAIHVCCYDGYGHFGDYDIYELIVEWNRDFIPEIAQELKNRGIEDSGWGRHNGIANLERYYRGEEISCELRVLGILIACYDEDNFRLPYPIKITSTLMEYDLAAPSKRDPFQGWES